MDIRDPDPVETGDWIEAIRSVVQFEGSARAFFEVDRHHVAVAALKALAEERQVP